MLKNRKEKNRPRVWHWRGEKKYCRKLEAELYEKQYFEDCNFAPCEAMEIEIPRLTHMGVYSCDLSGVSLLTGLGSSCSFVHCRPKPLTKEEAFERRDYHKKHGEVAYRHKYIYPDATLEEVRKHHEEFLKEWRPQEYALLQKEKENA